MKHLGNECMFIVQKSVLTFWAAFNQMNCQWPAKKASSKPQISAYRSPLDRVFGMMFFTKSGLYLTFSHVYIWSISIFFFATTVLQNQSSSLIQNRCPMNVSAGLTSRAQPYSLFWKAWLALRSKSPSIFVVWKDPISTHVLFPHTRKRTGCGVRLKWQG